MTPFHPKLRKALLSDQEHRARGLTSRRLKEYEEIAKNLEYNVYYPPLKYRITRKNIDNIAHILAPKYETHVAKITVQLKKMLGQGFFEKTIFLDALAELLGKDIREIDKNLEESILESACPPEQVQKIDPVIRIIEFRKKYMPNYKKIADKFVENQQRAIEKVYCDFNPLKKIKTFILILVGWSDKFFPGKKTSIDRRSKNEKNG